MPIVPAPKGYNEKTTVHNALIRLSGYLKDASDAVNELMEYVDKIPQEKFAELFEKP